jgi:AbrB family looped-hinge helix DNA binding protein
MKKSSTLGSRGRITIPPEVCTRLGLKKGDRVAFVFENGRTTIRPARSLGNPFLKYIGVLPALPGHLNAKSWIRKLRIEGAGRE